MKMFSIIILAMGLGLGFSAHAGDTSPIQPEIQKKFDSLRNIVRVPYDFAVSGGAISSIPLNSTLPAGVIVTQVWVHSLTTPTSAGTPAVTLTCGGKTLVASVDPTTYTAGASYPGAATGSAATMIDSASTKCTMTLNIATATMTAGKFVAYVEYVNK